MTKHNRKDRDTSRDHAAAQTKKNTGAEVKPDDGEIVQNKMTLGEGMAAGAPAMEDVGKGSVRETAPAVEGNLAAEASERVVQQGDVVVLHTRNPWNETTENVGKVLKVNQDQTIAVRIPLQQGGAKDFSPVYNKPQNGEDWWSWASDEQAEKLDRQYPSD